MPQLSDGLIRVPQVGTIPIVSPPVTGVIACPMAIVQMQPGPRLPQPHDDIAKLFRGERVLAEGAGLVFRAVSSVALACYGVVSLLIPGPRSFPAEGSRVGDILGGGFILALRSRTVWLVAPTARDTTSRCLGRAALSVG